MDLRKQLLTKNECYITGETMKVRGVMWHSTGANNPNIKRYVGPDDGLLGNNQYGNHWNQFRPDGRRVCVHAFVGFDKNEDVCTYQTLPWNYVGWHTGGSANDGYIGFEICEDELTDPVYFEKVYKESVELTVYLCKKHGLDPLGENVIICHQDGYKLGIASNHGDVYHWFNKHGKTMNDVRNDVAASMGTVTPPTPTPTPSKSIDELAREVINGEWGNDPERTNDLNEAGYNASAVQARVNELVSGETEEPTPVPTPSKSITELAREVINGEWGNDPERTNDLNEAGYNASAVQAEVNRLLTTSIPTPTPSKSITELAREVINGEWGNDPQRTNDLNAAGYDASAVQVEVNRLLIVSTPVPSKSIDELAREVINGEWGNDPQRTNDLNEAGYNASAVQARVNELL